MTKPIVTVVGNLGYYSSPNPVASKIIWDGAPTPPALPAFTAPADEQLKNPYMPITASGNAPYVFSFLNKKAAAPQFRVALSNYAFGNPGSSQFWFYDPTGGPNTGTSPQAAWAQKSGPTAFNPPFNPYALANIDYNSNSYLVVADYDSASNAGGTLCLLSMTSADVYAKVAALSIPNKIVSSNTYQAHVQDVYVAGSRIFALVIYSNTISSPPPNLAYINSEVREYNLTSSGSSTTFNLVRTVEISKNGVSLIPYTSGNNKYLFIPCIGGMQRYGNNNGADSSLSMIQIASSSSTVMSTERKSYIGGTYPNLHDFRGLAIATDGTAYILTGDYTSGFVMQWILYQTTAANLVALADATATGTIDADDIAAGTHGNAFFWSIGICSNSTNEYLVFGKGTMPNPPSAQDEVHFLQVGEDWNNNVDNYNFIVPHTALSDNATSGFAINSMDISVPGGVVRLKTPHFSQHPAKVRAMAAKVEEEESKK